MDLTLEINVLAAELVAMLQAQGKTFATAESCTGGAISQAVTSVPGCSSVMRGAVVAYHNDVKAGVLGVGKDTLSEYGAVSEEVVVQMVRGVSVLLDADCAVATSGIAGPGGGTPEKPVGTVWIAAKVGRNIKTRLLQLEDAGRVLNVKSSVMEVLRLVLGMLSKAVG
ncbi:MAG: CinA family protein [Bacteroidaceae bacterium]|nr:CinA family protein [Bacteroidaceae bacterium]